MSGENCCRKLFTEKYTLRAAQRAPCAAGLKTDVRYNNNITL